MTTMTSTDARKNWFEVIRKSVKGHRVYEISGKEGDVILMSKEDYEEILETLELMSTPGLVKSVHQARKDIKAGKSYSFDEVFGG